LKYNIMTAFEKIKLLVATILTNNSYKQVSPVIYDKDLLNKKVAILMFQENENGHLIRKFKVVVEDVTKEEDLTTKFSITTEEIPLVYKFTS